MTDAAQTKPPQERPEPPVFSWAIAAWIAVGIGLVMAAVAVGQHFELNRTLLLDLQGARVAGEAEPMEGVDGAYRIRYRHPTGAIHSRRYEGGFGTWLRPHPPEDEPLIMTYVPETPTEFQPANISRLPSALALSLFAVGMACVLRARRRILVYARARVQGPPPATGATD